MPTIKECLLIAFILISYGYAGYRDHQADLRVAQQMQLATRLASQKAVDDYRHERAVRAVERADELLYGDPKQPRGAK